MLSADTSLADLGYEVQCGSGGVERGFWWLKSQIGRKKQVENKPGFLMRLMGESYFKRGQSTIFFFSRRRTTSDFPQVLYLSGIGLGRWGRG